MKFKKWDVYRANFDPVVGSEQGKSRPVLIISEDYINEFLNNVNILPITSRKIGRQIYPNEALIEANKFGLEKESIVLSHQIRTLDKSRLSLKFGEISAIDNQIEIMQSLCFQLGIEQNK